MLLKMHAEFMKQCQCHSASTTDYFISGVEDVGDPYVISHFSVGKGCVDC